MCLWMGTMLWGCTNIMIPGSFVLCSLFINFLFCVHYDGTNKKLIQFFDPLLWSTFCSFVMDVPRSSADANSPWQWEDTGVTDTNAIGQKIGPKGESTWLNVSPAGFRSMLNWISNRWAFGFRFGNTPLFDPYHDTIIWIREGPFQMTALLLVSGPGPYPTLDRIWRRTIPLRKIAPVCCIGTAHNSIIFKWCKIYWNISSLYAHCTLHFTVFQYGASTQKNTIEPTAKILMTWINSSVHRRYGNPAIVVTESGCDVPDESSLPLAAALNDTFRVEYYRSYLEAATAAKHEDGVNLQVWLAAICRSRCSHSCLHLRKLKS